MRKISKKLLAILLVCVVSISLTGCGSNIKNELDNIVDQFENDNNQDEENKGNENNSNKDDSMKLYSDDTKLVFNMEDLYYIVFYHNGNEVTGLEYIYDYPDIETVKFFEKTVKASYEADDSVEKVEVKGKQLRIKFKKSVYDGQTVESIKQAYSYLEEMKGN